MCARNRVPVFLAALLLCASAAPALTPDQIALVVNKNSPNSIHLAQLYSAARGIPNDRTIVLNVPDAEEMEFDDYERNVVPPIRDFLRSHHLFRRVNCLVTFYGVPFRIRAKLPTDAEKQERIDLEALLNKTAGHVDSLLNDLDQFAGELDPSFKTLPERLGQMEGDWMAKRYAAAIQTVGRSIDAMTDPDQRRVALERSIKLMVDIGGPAELLRRVGIPSVQKGEESDAQKQRWFELRDQVSSAQRTLIQLEGRRYDAASRAQARALITKNFGPVLLAQALKTQIEYLTPGITNAALDNELALLWWNNYPRQNWCANPLNYQVRVAAGTLPTMMVSRLDGPNVPTVEDMIQTSVAVERKGLTGVLALNSHGYPTKVAPDGRNFYREFDQTIRDLGKLADDHSTLEVHQVYTHLFQHQEMKQTALYCGWYSVRNFIDGIDFVPGAVGYHVASLEMVALHDPNETGWVHGLLKHGVVATLGAVAEPYLSAFPPPDEFFPLLMTGKLTLAEVYWKTEPWTSWMICLVGDPLYNPFKNAPAMKVEDLPPDLQAALTRAGQPIAGTPVNTK